MKRTRLIALSSFLLICAGAAIFACSGDDNGGDGGADAKADQTTGKDGGSDATTKDGSPFGDSGNDATLGDSGSDATADDATADGSTDAGAATFMVLRVGGDVDAGADSGLTNSSTQVYVEERNISDGSLVRIIPIPTTASGSNQPLTLSGTATSEGALTRSSDGHYVMVTGFAATTGVASVAKTGSVDGGTMRVVARIDKAGNVDTTTELAAFDQGDIRSAASVDGTKFWATGVVNSDAGDTFGGVQYVALGSTGAATNITAVPYNTRVAGIFGGQLYISSSLTPNDGISAVGSGAPTTSNQTSALLPGFAGDSGSPYGFSMLDVDGSVAGLDVLYVADDSSQANGGGIQKWVFDGNTWTKITTFTSGTTSGFRGVMAVATSAGVVVIGTTSSTSTNGNTIIEYLDDGSTLTPTGTVLATAPQFTLYRGVAPAPQ